MRRVAWLAALVLALLSTAARGGGEVKEPIAVLDPGFELADRRIADVDGDGAAEVVLIGAAGEVRVWHDDGQGKGMAAKAVGSFVLPYPSRSLLAIGDLKDGKGVRLVVLSPRKITAHSLGEDGGFASEGETLIRSSRRAKLFPLRVGRPRFAGILSDLNGDDRLDIVIPGPERIAIWLCRPEGEGEKQKLHFQRTATVETDLFSSRTFDGKRLSSQHESAFRIPSLDLKDVNGDDRPDLTVRDDEKRAFHLQREDGTIPEKPDRVLDLSIFRDSAPPARIRPGRTLAGGRKATLQTPDLDNDGIQDYVIAHRRKIWIFHGSRDGPNFTAQSRTLVTAEEVSALLVLPLDDDDFPDLLLLRVQVPSIASLVSGFFSELEVEISASGYASEKGRTFSKLPKWKGVVSVRLPAISAIIKNPQALMARFEATASKFRAAKTADFDGDGTDDVAMLAEDRSRIDVWKVEPKPMSMADLVGLRALFFEDKKREWSLDDVLTLLGGIAEERTRRLTDGRVPDRTIVLPGGRYEVLGFEAADIDGDGRSEAVVFARDGKADGAARITIFRPIPE
jgi:hypothetical protein